jgi:hypothetical protein
VAFMVRIGTDTVLRATIALLVVLCLSPVGAWSQDGDGPAQVRPTPRFADGRVNMGALPGETGVWSGSWRLAINPNADDASATLTSRIHVDDVPLQPWARALQQYRHDNYLRDEPHSRCKPSPGPRQYTAPYGVEIVPVPEIERVYVFKIGGPHTYQEIYMDGRPHPQNLMPSYYGHSVGHWEGDTLVVDTVGFNERAWMSRDALPHTDRLHLIERLTRVDFDTLDYEVTIDDPGAYTAPWSSGFTLTWNGGMEMFEYVCQDNNRSPAAMVGRTDSFDRISRIIP